MKQLLLSLVVGFVLSSPAFAADKVWIDKASELYSVTVTHQGKKVEIKRNQNPKNLINAAYQPTGRGVIAPMNPFAPHAIETIGELEMLQFLVAKEKDSNILVIDSRTPDWVEKGTIPGSINVPYTTLRGDAAGAMDFLETAGVTEDAMLHDFSKAKTLVMFCNGAWCGQSPAAIRTLLKFGYPASKIKYYRGGMQSWESLGLTVVK
ncbi:MAG: rhodanese-like domain-containing protein [bacterium]|nr:rhodanese-like domain-containing protein [bacterium]